MIKTKTFFLTLALFSFSAYAGTMAEFHAEKGVKCEGCHTAQMSEKPTKEKCFACHGNYQDLIARTSKADVNPHDSHLGEIQCVQCHSGHKQMTLPCWECHGHVFDNDMKRRSK